MLQFVGKSKQERFLEAVKSLNLSFPGVEIAVKLKKKEPIVSTYLSGARIVSDKFLKTFCEVYGFDFDEIRGTGKGVSSISGHPGSHPDTRALITSLQREVDRLEKDNTRLEKQEETSLKELKKGLESNRDQLKHLLLMVKSQGAVMESLYDHLLKDSDKDTSLIEKLQRSILADSISSLGT